MELLGPYGTGLRGKPRPLPVGFLLPLFRPVRASSMSNTSLVQRSWSDAADCTGSGDKERFEGSCIWLRTCELMSFEVVRPRIRVALKQCTACLIPQSAFMVVCLIDEVTHRAYRDVL